MSIGYVVNEGITTKVFTHQGKYYTSLYKNNNGREILVHTMENVASEVTSHEILLSRISEDSFLCFKYIERKREYCAYFENIWIDNQVLKHVIMEKARGNSLMEALDNLERKIKLGRIRKYE